MLPLSGTTSPSPGAATASGGQDDAARKPSLYAVSKNFDNSLPAPTERQVEAVAVDVQLACFHPWATKALPDEQTLKADIALVIEQGMGMSERAWCDEHNSISVAREWGQNIRLRRLCPEPDTARLFCISWACCPFVLKVQKGDRKTMSERECIRADRECKNELFVFKRAHNMSGVIRHYACGEFRGRAWVLMEQAGSDLFDRDRDAFLADTEKTLIAARDIIQGVKSLHDNNILHRDIKPENILCCDFGCKLADFGHACEQGRYDPNKLAGTREFWPPECQVKNGVFRLRQQRWEKPADIWALGLTLADLSGLAEEEHTLVWRKNGQTMRHPSLNAFYRGYAVLEVDDCSLEQWVRRVTDRTFAEFLREKISVPEYSHDIPWQVQFCIATLACIRANPELRPSAEELYQWSLGFPRTLVASHPQLQLPALDRPVATATADSGRAVAR